MPRVLNKYRDTASADAIYIGRPGPWGNPFEIGKDGTREEVITQYRTWLLGQPSLIQKIRIELRGKDLLCFCAPCLCHGDILLAVANADESADLEAVVPTPVIDHEQFTLF